MYLKKSYRKWQVQLRVYISVWKINEIIKNK